MAGPQNIPVVGSFFDNPNEEAKLQGMRQAGRVYAANRPQVAQARQNALANQMFAYQPAMNAMALMYGPAGAMQPSMMARSPFTGATPGPPPPVAAGPAAAAPEPAGGGRWGPSGAMDTLRTEMGGRPVAGSGGWGPSGAMAQLRTEMGAKPVAGSGGWGPSGAVDRLNRVSREAGRQRAEQVDASSGSGKFGGFYK